MGKSFRLVETYSHQVGTNPRSTQPSATACATGSYRRTAGTLRQVSRAAHQHARNAGTTPGGQHINTDLAHNRRIIAQTTIAIGSGVYRVLSSLRLHQMPQVRPQPPGRRQHQHHPGGVQSPRLSSAYPLRDRRSICSASSSSTRRVTRAPCLPGAYLSAPAEAFALLRMVRSPVISASNAAFSSAGRRGDHTHTGHGALPCACTPSTMTEFSRARPGV